MVGKLLLLMVMPLGYSILIPQPSTVAVAVLC
jgi:hypothetical protein